jgi:CBS domain-containing protein
MTITRTALLELTAGDLMTTPRIVIPREMSMRRAAQVLLDKRIHGAPVVDEEGHCVGVLSTMDFLNAMSQDRKRVSWPIMGEEFFAAWQILDPDELPEDAVGNYMTVDVVTVSPADSIFSVAQKMVGHEIHRLLVVAEDRKPVGIVTCTDLLAAFADAG